jgi:hypothetical protein
MLSYFICPINITTDINLYTSIITRVHKRDEYIRDDMKAEQQNIYYEGFAQSIARQRLSKHVPTHAPRNNTVEVFSLCPRMDRCYKTHAR